MTKIANPTFQIFLCSIPTHQSLNISCILKKERIIHDLAYLAWKKIEKDYANSRIQNHQCKRFLAWISNLIQSHIYTQCKPNHRNKQAALRQENNIAIFDQKFGNWKLYCRVFQGLRSIPIACLLIQESFPIKIKSPYIQNW